MTNAATRRTASVVLLCLGALAVAACSDAGAQERIELRAEDLPPSAGTTAAGAFQSVGWSASGDAWHRYPGRGTVVLHHPLGRVPASVLVYVAFTDAGSGAGLASGDMARVVEVDAESVSIRNDTEADFYCRIVVQ